MKPSAFEYHAPETVTEAIAVLAEHRDEARLLAGGQSLVPMLALRLARFAHLIDLGRIGDLHGVRSDKGALVVRSMTTQTDVANDPATASIPLLARSIPHIGHFQIRNRGTVGGSIAHADPAAELPAVALALDATLEVAGPAGTRIAAAADFFEGMWTTSLQTDEVLTAVRFPVWTGRSGFDITEVARRRGDFAITGVACAVELSGDDTIARLGIAMFGMGSTPVRGARAEASLVGTCPTAADLIDAGELLVRDCDPPHDLHASSRYRRVVGAHIVTEALGRALEEARA